MNIFSSIITFLFTALACLFSALYYNEKGDSLLLLPPLFSGLMFVVPMLLAAPRKHFNYVIKIVADFLFMAYGVAALAIISYVHGYYYDAEEYHLFISFLLFSLASVAGHFMNDKGRYERQPQPASETIMWVSAILLGFNMGFFLIFVINAPDDSNLGFPVIMLLLLLFFSMGTSYYRYVNLTDDIKSMPDSFFHVLFTVFSLGLIYVLLGNTVATVNDSSNPQQWSIVCSTIFYTVHVILQHYVM